MEEKEIIDMREPDEEMDDIVMFDKVVTTLATTNREGYNLLKVCEELAELQEKLLKFHTKGASQKPKMPEITEEMGDVIFRITVLMEEWNVEEEVADRIVYKSKKYNDYMNQGLYKGGI